MLIILVSEILNFDVCNIMYLFFFVVNWTWKISFGSLFQNKEASNIFW